MMEEMDDSHASNVWLRLHWLLSRWGCGLLLHRISHKPQIFRTTCTIISLFPDSTNSYSTVGSCGSVVLVLQRFLLVYVCIYIYTLLVV